MNVLRMLSLAMIFSILVFAGCAGTPQTRFYTLTPMTQQQAGKPTVETKKITVNIAPVEVPDHLTRVQIVTRDGRNVLKMAEYDRWAGPLAESMAFVLAENLAQLLGSEQVFAHPRMQSTTSDFTVAVRVLQLDSVPGDQTRLKVQWTVFAGADRKETVTRMSDITEKLTDTQYTTIASAVSRTLEQLSSEIARELRGAVSPSK